MNQTQPTAAPAAPKKESMLKKPWMQSILIIIGIFSALGFFLFWQSAKGTVFIENSVLQAPIVNLSPAIPGTLNALYVSEGDTVEANTQVALVGSQILTAPSAGIVTFAPNVIGTYFLPGQTVVSFVKNQEMKVVGSIEETKGLNALKAGQPVTFTVDAFPGRTYKGIVEKISATSVDTGVVFSISDKRPIKKFEVTAQFNSSLYPELRNGMSAKMSVNIR